MHGQWQSAQNKTCKARAILSMQTCMNGAGQTRPTTFRTSLQCACSLQTLRASHCAHLSSTCQLKCAAQCHREKLSPTGKDLALFSHTQTHTRQVASARHCSDTGTLFSMAPSKAPGTLAPLSWGEKKSRTFIHLFVTNRRPLVQGIHQSQSCTSTAPNVPLEAHWPPHSSSAHKRPTCAPAAFASHSGTARVAPDARLRPGTRRVAAGAAGAVLDTTLGSKSIDNDRFRHLQKPVRRTVVRRTRRRRLGTTDRQTQLCSRLRRTTRCVRYGRPRQASLQARLTHAGDDKV